MRDCILLNDLSSFGLPLSVCYEGYWWTFFSSVWLSGPKASTSATALLCTLLFYVCVFGFCIISVSTRAPIIGWEHRLFKKLYWLSARNSGFESFYKDDLRLLSNTRLLCSCWVLIFRSWDKLSLSRREKNYSRLLLLSVGLASPLSKLSWLWLWSLCLDFNIDWPATLFIIIC